MIEPDSPLHAAYGWAAPTLGVLMGVNSDLMRMAAAGGPNTVHLIGAMLAARESEALAEPVHWAERLAHAPRADLLSAAYGPWPEMFARALAKLGPRVLPREAYAALHRAVAMPEFAMVLRRRTRIGRELIALLAVPEARRLHPKLLTALSFDDAEGVEALGEALALRVRTPPWSEHLDQLSACETPAQLFKWFEYHWERPFPAPPWAGDELLEPITDADTLRRFGAEMRNCLAEQVPDVGRGLDYYYITRRMPRIAVGLHLRAGKWFATQILEARNRRPKPAARREVLAHLVDAGIPVDLDHETYRLLERVLELEDPDDEMRVFRVRGPR